MSVKSVLSYTPLLIAALLLIGFFARYLYRTPTYVTGEMSTDISGVLPSGDTARLSDIRNKYILLDFWGSWCGPCIAEIPDLIQLYDSYHAARFTDGDGFEIFSVGIESNRERWFQTIQYEGMKWQYHISDQQNFDSPIARQYGVRYIPAHFLIDPKGRIITVNQPLADVDKILKDRLASN